MMIMYEQLFDDIKKAIRESAEEDKELLRRLGEK